MHVFRTITQTVAFACLAMTAVDAQPTKDNQITHKTKKIEQSSKTYNFEINNAYHQFYKEDKPLTSINESLLESIKLATRDFVADVKSAHNQEGLKVAYQENKSTFQAKTEILLLTESLLSVRARIDHNEPMGTYFPSITYQYFNYELKKEKPISLEALFKPGEPYLPKLNEIAISLMGAEFPKITANTPFYLMPNQLAVVGKYTANGRVEEDLCYIQLEALSDLLKEKFQKTLIDRP